MAVQNATSKNQLEAQVIAPFTIVDWKQAHLPEDFNTKFDLGLDKFRKLSLNQNLSPPVMDVEYDNDRTASLILQEIGGSETGGEFNVSPSQQYTCFAKNIATQVRSAEKHIGAEVEEVRDGGKMRGREPER